jgi:hypothetical protein
MAAMTSERASSLYAKLAPFLSVVKGDGSPIIEPYGCYPPCRNGRNDLRDWPLHSWRGPGTSPLCVSWSPDAKRRPTFEQFLRVYGISVEGGA